MKNLFFTPLLLSFSFLFSLDQPINVKKLQKWVIQASSVSIHSPNGEIALSNIDNKTTVLDVKTMLQDSEHLPLDKQTLLALPKYCVLLGSLYKKTKAIKDADLIKNIMSTYDTDTFELLISGDRQKMD